MKNQVITDLLTMWGVYCVSLASIFILFPQAKFVLLAFLQKPVQRNILGALLVFIGAVHLTVQHTFGSTLEIILSLIGLTLLIKGLVILLTKSWLSLVEQFVQYRIFNTLFFLILLLGIYILYSTNHLNFK